MKGHACSKFLSHFCFRYEMINGGPPFVVRVKDDYLIRLDVISHVILCNSMIELEVIKGRDAFFFTSA